MDCRPRAQSARHCHGVLALREGPLTAELRSLLQETRASWQLAVQEGKQIEGLKLVSSQFRKQRLAVWAAGRGWDLSFTAMVFWPCERVL